jgi:polysaccharide biosynthesis transport protein
LSTIPADFTAPSERELDLRYYTDLLWRARWVLLTTAIVGLGLGVLIGYLQTPEYRATVMIQIEPPTPTFMSVTDALVGGGGYWQNTDFYNTQFKILRSKAIGEKALEKLKLTDKPPFKDLPDPAGVFMSHVSIEPIPESRLVNVHVIHTDPKESALWANTVAEVYMEQSLSVRVDAARRASDWLQERLADTQKNMREAQKRLFESYESQDIFAPDAAGSSPLVSTITKLSDEHSELHAKRIELEAILRQVAEVRKAKRTLDTIPQVAADSLVMSLNTQLSNLNLQLSQLKEQFKAAHPRVHEIQAQVDQIRQSKDARARQITDALEMEYNQTQKRETELRAAIDAQKGLAAQQSRKATEVEARKKEAESAKNLYEVLLQKLNETDIAASIKSATGNVVERAAAPSFPMRPQKKRIAGIALFAGLLLGIALVVGRDLLGNTIKDPDEIERYLHVDLIASVPRYDEANVHLVTEAYQNLRTAMLFARKEEGGQVVLVTGTAPQEGKTTTLLNIGKLLASSGEKTIVLDFDLRRAQLHSRLGLTREPGLTNFFVNHEDLDTLIRPTRVANLFALTAGPLPPNPPAILTRRNLPDFLDHLRRHFDWVMLDSPPLASVTDALLLARHADLVVVVVQHDKIDKRVIKRHIGALRRVTPNLLGVVLNAVDIKSKGYYYYYYQQTDGSSKSRSDAKPKAVASSKS